MFSHATNTWISGGVFNAHTHTHLLGANKSERWREGLKILQENISSGAFHNSSERFDPPKCHPHTREAVLQEIMRWVEHQVKITRFLWLYGPAGAGKSAIAQTIAEMCYKLKLLAASFFFSRSAPGRNDKTRFVSTLAYQLTNSIPGLRMHVGNALDDDPALLSRSLGAQMEALIVEPLNKISFDQEFGPSLQSRPKFILIDGLDECAESEDQKEILHVLSAAVEQLSFPIFFLIASRPESGIREIFNSKLSAKTFRLALGDNYNPDADIEVFLRSSFNDIKKKHPSGRFIPWDWPSDRDLRELVARASGQFIYASTAIKFIESHNHQPMERLKIIFGLSNLVGDSIPFSGLDALYHHILSSVHDIGKVLELFSYLFLLPRGSFPAELYYMEKFLFYNPGDLYTVLNDLHSIVFVPDSVDRHATETVRVLHASLGDFFLDPQRSKSFYIDSGMANAKFTRYFIKHMNSWSKNREAAVFDNFQWSMHSSFLEHCIQSNHTKELMNDLLNFDLEPYLGIICELPLFNEQLENVPELLEWILQEPHVGPEREIHFKYSYQLDHWFRAQIRLYPEEFQLLAALVYSHPDDNPHPPGLLFRMITFGNKPTHLNRKYDLAKIDNNSLNLYQLSGRPCKYSDMLTSNFLNIYKDVPVEPSKHYLQLTMKVSQFILAQDDPDAVSEQSVFMKGSPEWNPPVEQIALELLPRLLDRTPASRELAVNLRDNLNLLSDEWNIDRTTYSKASRAIEQYIEKGDAARTQ